MQRASGESPVTISCGASSLEGALAVPPGAVRGAVVCHPHPLYGGSMDSSVVRAVTAALEAAGVATLRFNFRGVGRSDGRFDDGVGETNDTRAAVAFLAEKVAGEITLAGYSFGAAVALRAGAEEDRVGRLVGIAPPTSRFDFGFASGIAKPLLLVAPERDEYGPPDEVEALAASVAGERLVVLVPGADHFLFGAEPAVAEAVVRFVAPPG